VHHGGETVRRDRLELVGGEKSLKEQYRAPLA